MDTTWLAALTAALQGNQAGQDANRVRAQEEAQRQQQALLFQQQQEDRQRNQALQRMEFTQKMAAPLVGRNNEAALDYLQSFQDSANAAGLPVSNAAIVGGTKQVPIDVPTSYGPQRMKTVKDYANPQTTSAIASALGLPAPKPEAFELSPGQSRYTVGMDGKPALQVTAPVAENPYKLSADQQIAALQDKLENALKLATLNNGVKIQIAGMHEAGANGRAAASASKPKMGWVQRPDGTKVWAQLDDGTVAQGAPKPVKEFDEQKAWNIAKSRFPSVGGVDIPGSATMKQREAFVESERKAFNAKQAAAAGDDPAAALLEGMAAWRNRGKGGKQ